MFREGEGTEGRGLHYIFRAKETGEEVEDRGGERDWEKLFGEEFLKSGERERDVDVDAEKLPTTQISYSFVLFLESRIRESSLL